MAKKKSYVNKYKAASQNPSAQEQQATGGGKRKLTFKAFIMGVAIMTGIAAFFTPSETIAWVAMALFVIGGCLMGKEQIIFLGIGALMGLLIALANEGASIPITIALVWSLFYIVLMLSGMFMMRRRR